MQTSELVRLTVKELQNLSKKLGIKEFSGVRKQDLIKLILDYMSLSIDGRTNLKQIKQE